MEQTEKQTSVSLPAGLRRQFAAMEHRLWTLETTGAFCVAVGGLLLSYLVLFFSDRFWDTPVWLRVLITILGIGTIGWSGYRWSKRWVFQRRDLRALSVIVQERFRRLGDRLLGIVELTEERQRPPNFSPDLYRAAVQQVSNEAVQFNFREAVSLGPAKVHAWIVCALFLVVLAPVVLVPSAGANAFLRWIAPWAGIPRYTLVSVEGLPREQIVPHGEAFEIAANVRYRSFWKPARALGQFEDQPKISADVAGDRVQLRVPGQVQRGALRIRVGDGEQRMNVLPTHRPSLTELSAAITLPEYLRYPLATANAKNGVVKVLEGSQVAFEGKTTRPLAAAQIQMQESRSQMLKVQGDQFSSEASNLDEISQCIFTWQDQTGLAGLGAWRLTIEKQKDAAPQVELLDQPREIGILETEVLPLKVAARDDFGVRDFGVSWEILSDWQQTNSVPAQRFEDGSTTSRQKKLESTFPFSPAVLQIPADSTVELRAYATDFFPERPRSESAAYRVHVLGNEKHAELIRQKLESLLSRLEEVTRLEEKIAANTRELKELPQEKLQAEEAKGPIETTAQDQSQNAANLEQMAKEGMRTLREAVRNPIFSESSIREWTKSLQEMKQLSEQQMQEAAQSLKNAQQKGEARGQNLDQAQKKEEEILQALSEMQKNVNQGLDQLQALTLAQRLRKLGSEEKKIETELLKMVSETIGLLPQDLPAQHQKANLALSVDQEQAQKESTGLQGEISRFFERTQKENYAQVSKEMVESRTSEELDRVRGLIQENISMEASQNLTSWTQRFNAWADLLEPKSDASAGGGEGSGKQGQDLTKQLMALLRLREREVNVQDQTRVLERKKTDPSVYPEGTRTLSSTQKKLRENLGEIQKTNPLPEVEKPLAEAQTAMEAAEAFLNKPQTDKTAQQSQTRSIEMLSDAINLINEQAQRGDAEGHQNSSSSQEMAFLLQMMALENGMGMGVGMGSAGGGSQAGGTTERASTPAPGDARGKRAEARPINKASGTTQNVPVEFREALEHYYNAVEKEQNQ